MNADHASEYDHDISEAESNNDGDEEYVEIEQSGSDSIKTQRRTRKPLQNGRSRMSGSRSRVVAHQTTKVQLSSFAHMIFLHFRKCLEIQRRRQSKSSS